ncbi:Leader peptidase (Prepilin peptidase)/N-methyltransferase OS=Castellaniella defragrans OX=75697 GN=HNR28_001479 PE=3 SV=1 [Castellaniella defragrans]
MLFGACLRRWASVYAGALAAGAGATAGTLWTAFRAAARRRQGYQEGGGRFNPVKDGALALLMGAGAAFGLLARGPAALAPVALCLFLVALAWIDARSGLLPDALTLPLMVAGWGCGPLSLVAASSASALVWAGLASVAAAYRWARGRDGLGGGDIKYLAALAGWLGVVSTLTVLWFASLLGGLAWLCLARVRREGACAFGPCLTLAALPVVWWGGGSWAVFGLPVG